jgi:hypothetical protein
VNGAKEQHRKYSTKNVYSKLNYCTSREKKVGGGWGGGKEKLKEVLTN